MSQTIQVASGWRDFGLKIRGPLARELAAASDEMFAGANLRHKPFSRLRKSAWQRTVTFAGGEILLAGPGRNNTIKLALSRDLKRARQVAIICACFLPPGRILRQMARLARRGIKVQLILPGKSDVFLSHLAARAKLLSPPFAGWRRDGSKARLARWESSIARYGACRQGCFAARLERCK